MKTHRQFTICFNFPIVCGFDVPCYVYGPTLMRNYFALNLLLIALLYLATFGTVCAQSLPYVISGDIHDSSGQKISRARVCAMPEENIPGKFFPCAFSDADGKFQIRWKEPGKYRLIFDKTADGYMPQHLPFYRHPAISVPEVILDSSNSNQYVSINTGPKSGTLIGKSVDIVTNLPVENIQITLCHAANPLVCYQSSAKNAKGRFQVRTPLVPFTLRITSDGFEDWSGLSASDKPDAVINVASGTTLDLAVYLKRRKEAAANAINEAEKQVGLHLPAPVQLSPSDNEVFNYYPRETKLEWRSVEGAVSYSVEVDYCERGKQDRQACVNPQPLQLKNNPQTSGLVDTNYKFKFIGATLGRWRVWAVDKEGREGFKSPWRKFFYLQ